MTETWSEKLARLRTQWVAQDAEAKAAVEQYRREHGIDRNKPSGDADTGSLTHDEEEELRRRHG